MVIVKSAPFKLRDFLVNNEHGNWGLPEFQRTFVWDFDRVKAFWDSLYQRYPIGQVLLWKPRDDDDFPMRRIGKNQSEIKNAALGIMDGQQRLTAIYLVLKGEIELVFDAKEESFVAPRETFRDPRYISLNILEDESAQDIPALGYFDYKTSQESKDKYRKQINLLNGILNDIDIQCQELQNCSYNLAVEMFDRVNQQGIRVSEAQIILARISAVWPGVFRRTHDLMLHLNDTYNLAGSSDPGFVIQTWTAIHTGQHQIKHLASGPRGAQKYRLLATAIKYEDSWNRMSRAVNRAIELLHKRLYLDDFALIPSSYALTAMVNYLANNESLQEDELIKLAQWIIESFTSRRYAVRAVSRLRDDIRSTSKLSSFPLPINGQITSCEPDSLRMESRRSPFLTLLYAITRRNEARDWLDHHFVLGRLSENGDRLKDSMDQEFSLHVHHIFPRERFKGDFQKLEIQAEDLQDSPLPSDQIESKLDGIEKQKQILSEDIDQIANLAFLKSSTNESIGENPPAEYLKDIIVTEEGCRALEAQYIPLDKSLWNHSRVQDFWAERRRLLANAIREFLVMPPKSQA